jgi:hypothetical protein
VYVDVGVCGFLCSVVFSACMRRFSCSSSPDASLHSPLHALMAASSSAGPSTPAGLRVATYNVGAMQANSFSGKRTRHLRAELHESIKTNVEYLGNRLHVQVVLVQDLHDPSQHIRRAGPNQIKTLRLFEPFCPALPCPALSCPALLCRTLPCPSPAPASYV